MIFFVILGIVMMMFGGWLIRTVEDSNGHPLALLYKIIGVASATFGGTITAISLLEVLL